MKNPLIHFDNNQQTNWNI